VLTGWRLVTGGSEHTETFDASGRLTGITTREGRSVTLTHDANGRLHRVIAQDGRGGAVGGDVAGRGGVGDQGAPGRLDHAHAPFPALPGDHQVAALQIGVMEQFLDHLGGVQHLDHARPVVAQGRPRSAAAVEGHEVPAFVVGEGSGDEVALGDAGQRSHPVPALLGAELAEEREFHVGPGLHLLVDVVPVMAILQVVEQGSAVPIPGAQAAVVEVHGAVGADEGQAVGAEAAEAVVEVQVLLEQAARHAHRLPAPADDRIDVLEQEIAFLRAQVLVDAAGDRTGAVHPLAGGEADDFLAVLAQQHALLRHIRILGGDAHDVAPGHVGIEAEQQVRRRQVEEMQGVGLQDLAIVHEPAQLLRRGCEAIDTDDLVHGLGGGQVVGYRADAAQALHHHRDLPIGPALDELLEAPEFDDVQTGLLDAVILVQQQGDLAMALHPGEGLDGDPAQGLGAGGGFEFGDHDWLVPPIFMAPT